MADKPLHQRIGRRTFIAGAAGGAAVVGTATFLRIGRNDPVAEWEGVVVSRFVDEALPEDASSSLWGRARQVEVPMTSQMSVIPFRPEPAVESIRVRSLYNSERVGFVLEWRDEQQNERVVKTDEFRDGCAVLLGPPDAPAAFYMMGTPEVPASVLYWRADWQKDIDAGFQDLESAFPNAAFDWYPPLIDAPHPLPVGGDYPEEGRPWIVGWTAGNPLSNPVKHSAVEKLVGRGPGTLEHQATQDADGRGTWSDGRWQVVLSRPLDATDDGETTLEPGGEHALVFSVWSGAEGDRGARKSPSGLGKLLLERA
jgi:hypothetical protein